MFWDGLRNEKGKYSVKEPFSYQMSTFLSFFLSISVVLKLFGVKLEKNQNFVLEKL